MKRFLKKEVEKDVRSDGKGLKVFVVFDDRPLLQGVKVMNVSGPDDLMVSCSVKRICAKYSQPLFRVNTMELIINMRHY